MTTQTFNDATGSPFIVPAGVTSIRVQCWGEGAAGSTQVITNAGGAPGGGGGEYAEEPTYAVTPSQSIPYTVPSGSSGLDTTWDTAGVVAHHGIRTAGPANSPGGPGGTGSTNTIHFNGGVGGVGLAAGGGGGGGEGAGSSSVGGAGGAGTAGVGGAGGTGTDGGDGGVGAADNATPATAGIAPGGGGGGCVRTGGITAALGAGAPGRIVITYTAAATAGNKMMLLGVS